MSVRIPVRREDDILPEYQSTPVGDLFRYHNLRVEPRRYTRAELVIGMCMDNRHVFRLPDNFAYILRTGGANLQRIEFKVSFAVAVGRVRHMCLIGHNQCGMVDLRSKRAEFVSGLVECGGWTTAAAEAHFDRFAPEFEIPDAAEFVLTESQRLRNRYPGIMVAPLLYQIDDGLLYQLAE